MIWVCDVGLLWGMMSPYRRGASSEDHLKNPAEKSASPSASPLAFPLSAEIILPADIDAVLDYDVEPFAQDATAGTT